MSDTDPLPPCAKCGCTEIIANVQLKSSDGSELKAAVHANPKALLFKEAVESPLRATMCCKCGRLEIFATYPQFIAKAAKRAESREER